MSQSNVSKAPRQTLTEQVLQAKATHNLTWAALSEGTGLSTVYVTAALLGQHPLPQAVAEVVAERLGLDAQAVVQLQTIPLRGNAEDVSNDPTIYRFHEMVQVYGTTLKALVHEQFGDGIISAINFKLDIKKVEDPEGGSRAVITLDGKFLPYKPF
ncbi:Cyanate hydratase [Pseudomonas sp. MM227]|jgi:cyanate lyase|uniref:cyanase n=1 Tax=unclassified Pseudomonas TaxID=196821 RepID=UPI000F0464ED|nr:MULTISPECIES: cyanase [unclassified Pseudomonas]MBD8472896.1 cyanase [Pseudomonas sp. CFBP 8773]MBD8646001.1 cyanase [Pseudomonas sp. CFBP 8770]MBD8825441.1 cyanase [Pseudomonas sp. CFBP 13602]CAI3788029.1 Cyanate hydratase [Pseudomonas sp. MM227]